MFCRSAECCLVSSRSLKPCKVHKGFPMKIAIAFSTALFLCLSALTFSGLQSVSACSGTNTLSLSLASGSVTRRADNTFDYVLLAHWNCKGKPFVGQVELVSSHG